MIQVLTLTSNVSLLLTYSFLSKDGGNVRTAPLTKPGTKSRTSLMERPYTLDVLYRIHQAGHVPVHNNKQKRADRFRAALHKFLKTEFVKQWDVWSREELRVALGPLLYTNLLEEVSPDSLHNVEATTTDAPHSALTLTEAIRDLIDEQVDKTCGACGLAVFLKNNTERTCRYCATPEKKQVPNKH